MSSKQNVNEPLPASVLFGLNCTKRRLLALRYAAGEGDDRQPTIGVCRPLEKAGLIYWCGSFGIGFARVQNENCKRPWIITKLGTAALAQWQEPNVKEQATGDEGPGILP